MTPEQQSKLVGLTSKLASAVDQQSSLLNLAASLVGKLRKLHPSHQLIGEWDKLFAEIFNYSGVKYTEQSNSSNGTLRKNEVSTPCSFCSTEVSGRPGDYSNCPECDAFTFIEREAAHVS